MKSGTKVRDLTTIALMAALLAAVAPLSIEIGAVPISLATLILYLTVYILDWKGATIATLIYLILGAVGVPVFAGYTGGLSKLVGPTGGYLVGYIFVSLIAGFVAEKTKRHLVWTPVALVVSTAVLYLMGTLWYCFQTSNTFAQGLLVCVQPFVLIDLGKIVAATIVGKLVRQALVKAGLIGDKK